jgi:type VI secretion system secreted protein VgrG
VVESLEMRGLMSASALPNASYDDWIRAAAARQQYAVDGAGLAAAVIDTGIDYRHPALGGRLGPGAVVVGGYDLAMEDEDPLAETWSHGTMVAGLIASRDLNGRGGVAPGAGLVALRVFGNDNRGSFERIADALQWVVDRHEEYGITVVNLSISDNRNYVHDLWSKDGGVGERIAGLVEELARLRIPVVAATGNGYRGQEGVGFTAILPGTISVTGTEGDRLWSGAQRLSRERGGESATDLGAPATGLLTTVESAGYGRVEGTSFAAPLVTGAILLLQEIYRSRFGVLPRVEELLDWLQRGADPIRDGSGLTIGRLNVERSARLIPATPGAKPGEPQAGLPTAGPAGEGAGGKAEGGGGTPRTGVGAGAGGLELSGRFAANRVGGRASERRSRLGLRWRLSRRRLALVAQPVGRSGWIRFAEPAVERSGRGASGRVVG